MSEFWMDFQTLAITAIGQPVAWLLAFTIALGVLLALAMIGLSIVKRTEKTQ